MCVRCSPTFYLRTWCGTYPITLCVHRGCIHVHSHVCPTSAHVSSGTYPNVCPPVRRCHEANTIASTLKDPILRTDQDAPLCLHIRVHRVCISCASQNKVFCTGVCIPDKVCIRKQKDTHQKKVCPGSVWVMEPCSLVSSAVPQASPVMGTPSDCILPVGGPRDGQQVPGTAKRGRRPEDHKGPWPAMHQSPADNPRLRPASLPVHLERIPCKFAFWLALNV